MLYKYGAGGQFDNYYYCYFYTQGEIFNDLCQIQIHIRVHYTDTSASVICKLSHWSYWQ